MSLVKVQGSKGRVVMNRFKVFCLDREGKNCRFVLASDGDVTNEVFDKLRIFIGVFRDLFLVGTFQQTPNLAGGAALNHFNLLFNGEVRFEFRSD